MEDTEKFLQQMKEEPVAWLSVLAQEREKKWKQSRDVWEVLWRDLAMRWVWGIRESEILRKTPRFVTCTPGQTVACWSKMSVLGKD